MRQKHLLESRASKLGCVREVDPHNGPTSLETNSSQGDIGIGGRIGLGCRSCHTVNISVGPRFLQIVNERDWLVGCVCTGSQFGVGCYTW
jgi:hypothetical protein